MRRLPALVTAAGFTLQSVKSHGYVQTTNPAYLLTLLSRGANAAAQASEIGRSWLIASTGRRFGVLRTARFTEPCCSFPSPHAKTAIDCAFRSRWKDYRIKSENGHMSQTCFETWHLDLQEPVRTRGSAGCYCLYQPRSYRNRSHPTNHTAGNDGWADRSRCGELRILDRGNRCLRSPRLREWKSIKPTHGRDGHIRRPSQTFPADRGAPAFARRGWSGVGSGHQYDRRNGLFPKSDSSGREADRCYRRATPL